MSRGPFVIAALLALGAIDVLAQQCPPGQAWNGYQCAARQAGTCGCATVGGAEARCVEGSPGWWYVHVGGRQTRWTTGTDALCCTAQSAGGFQPGSPTGYGQAPCVSGGSRDVCEQALRALACGPTLTLREAGPLWNQAYAASKCPKVCAGGRWTGQWRTTVQGKMSVCECEGLPAAAVPAAPAAPRPPTPHPVTATPRPVPATPLPAGPTPPPVVPQPPIVGPGLHHVTVELESPTLRSGRIAVAQNRLRAKLDYRPHVHRSNEDLFRFEPVGDGTYLLAHADGSYVAVEPPPDRRYPGSARLAPERSAAEKFVLERMDGKLKLRSTSLDRYFAFAIRDMTSTDGGVRAEVQLLAEKDIRAGDKWRTVSWRVETHQP